MGERNQAERVVQDDMIAIGARRVLTEKGSMKGHVQIVNAKTGEVVRDFDNLVVTVGKNQAAGLFNGEQTSPFKYIALGTGTNAAAAGDTQLQAEIVTNGGARTLGTISRSDNVAKIEATFNFTGDLAVTEIGLFDAASDGNMACRQVFAVLNVKNGDQFIFRWEVTFN